MTALELDFLRTRLPPEQVTQFRHFLKRDGTGGVCPFFDEELWGCGIYEIRPFSCRVFGHFREEGTTLPPVCVFRGQEEIFRSGHYYETVPEGVNLRELGRDYWPYQKSEDFIFSETVQEHGPGVREEDPLGYALFVQSQGRPLEALQFLADRDVEETPFALYCVALMLEEIGSFERAAQALEQALAEAPHCVPLHFRLACNELSLGNSEKACAHLKATLSLKSTHSPALGMLGAHCLLNEEFASAVQYLTQAVGLEPANESFLKLLKTAKEKAPGTGPEAS